MIFAFIVLSYNLSAQKGHIRQVNSAQFKSIIKSVPGILLDVRTSHEFKNGHIENSDQLNFYSLNFKKKLLTLSKDQSIYLYCNTGYRSEKAAKTLIENGYSKVYNLQHGIMEWELQDYTVIIDPDANPDLINKFNLAQYESLIQSDSLVFIDFYAPWCAPCRKMMPMIDSLQVEYHSSINIVKINADASKKLMKELRIVSVPFLVLYKNGELLYKQDNAANRVELIKLFESASSSI